jgi:hypothetical protein
MVIEHYQKKIIVIVIQNGGDKALSEKNNQNLYVRGGAMVQ